MSCGIYKIENLVNGKIYIGQSVNIERRWKHHKTLLKHNIHKNTYLQNSWNKHGADNFIFNIIEECDRKILHSRENHWSNIFQAHVHEIGYNLTIPINGEKYILTEEGKRKIGEPRKGIPRSDNTKKLISKSLKGRKVSDQVRKNMSKPKAKWTDEKRERISKQRKGKKTKNFFRPPVPVLLIDAEGNMKRFESIKEASDKLGISSTNIVACCRGRLKTIHKMKFRYV